MAWSRSGANTRFFCQMRGKEGDTFSLCTMTDGSIPGMSSWVQVNMSQLLLRKAVSSWWTAGLARVLILVVRSWFESSRNTSSNFSTGSVISVFFYAHCLEVVVHFHHGHITFACGHLISSQLPHSVVDRKLNHQVVGLGYGLPRIEGGSPEDSIIGRRVVDH